MDPPYLKPILRITRAIPNLSMLAAIEGEEIINKRSFRMPVTHKSSSIVIEDQFSLNLASCKP